MIVDFGPQINKFRTFEVLKIALYLRSANSPVNKKSRLLQLIEYDKIRTYKL